MPNFPNATTDYKERMYEIALELTYAKNIADFKALKAEALKARKIWMNRIRK